MSFDAIIATLRNGADQRLKWSEENRRHASNSQKMADDFRKRADNDEELARSFDLLADALATGRLTKDQLRAIVTEANLEAEGSDAAKQPAQYTQAQILGNDCALCGHVLAPGQPVGEHPWLTGDPLFAHLACIETAEERAK